jgi:GntR family transcriptional regulator
MSTQPAYVRIAADIARRIRSGELAPGDQLPSRSELAERHGVSEIVIRNALGLLRSQGLVRTIERRGAFVAAPTLVRAAPERQLQSAETSFIDESGDVEVTREIGRTTAAPDVAEALGIETGADVTHVITRIKVDDQPVAISDYYEPLDLTRGTPIEDPRAGTPPHTPIVRFPKIGYPVDVLEETLSFRLPTEEHATFLNTPRGEMVATIRQQFRSGDRTVQFSAITYPIDRYSAFAFRMPLPVPGQVNEQG